MMTRQTQTHPYLVDIDGRPYSRATYHLWDISDDEASYLQTHACLAGPDAKENRRLRAKIASLRSWTIEVSTTRIEDISFHGFNTHFLDASLAQELYAIDAPAEDLGMHFWKLSAIADALRQGAPRMLCMGAANGLECRVAELFNERLQVTGTDFRLANQRFHNDLRPIPHASLLDAFGAGSFDVIYSNHVLEHVYGGLDELLKSTRSMLREGGLLVGGLPTETNPSNPYAHLFPDMITAKAPQRMFRLNPGHPWKTDLFGIHDRLTRAGFSNIHLYTLRGSRFDNAKAVTEALGTPSTSPKPTPHTPLPRAHRRLRSRLIAFIEHAAATRSFTESALKAYFSVEAANNPRPHKMHELLFVCSK